MQGLTHHFHHKERVDRQHIFFVDVTSLLMGFASGLLIYITSSYFKSIFGTDNIGWTYLIANVVLLLILINIHQLVRIVSKTALFHLIMVCKISFLIALVLLFGTTSGTVFLLLYIIFEALSWAVLSMILESYAVDRESGKIYGFNLTVTNIGFIIAPIAATQLLTHFGFLGVFYVSIVLNALIFLVAFFSIHTTNNRFTERMNYKGFVRKLKGRTDVLEIFSISFALEFFFAIMVIYTPLYLLDTGFTWSQIGTIFTIMLIPFVLTQYPIGLLADQKLGEKELLFVAFATISITSLLLYFSAGTTVVTIMIILFVSRIGAAFVEILRTSYFYKRVDGSNVSLISFFQTARPLAYIIAPALTSALLVFFPLPNVFILTAIVALLTLYPIYKLTDNAAQTDGQ